MSLVARLFVLVALAVLPAIAILASLQLELRRERGAQVGLEALRLAQFAAGEMDRLVEGARSLLLGLAQVPSVQNRDGPACSAYVARLIDDFPKFAGIGAVDTNGELFCLHTSPKAGALDHADRAWFRAAMASDSLVIGEVVRDRIADELVLPVAVPFTDQEGNLAGAVIGSLSLAWLNRHFAERALPEQGSIGIADGNGVLLVRLPQPPEPGQRMREDFLWMLRGINPGILEDIGPDGIERVVGYVPPGATGAHAFLVSVGLSKRTALAPIDAAARRGFAIIALVLALALALAWLGGRYFIARPVASLLGAAERWRQGDYAARAGRSDSTSELGRLGVAFDAMAGELERTLSELRAGEARLQLALQTVQMGVWERGIDTDDVHWDPVQYAICGLDPGEPPLRGEAFFDRLAHPDDRDEIRRKLMTAIRDGHDYAHEFRIIRPDGQVRWLAGRGTIIEDETDSRRMIGVNYDITERKTAEARRELLLHELNHRIKNLFALIQSLARQTVRHSEDLPGFEAAFLGRLDALARLSSLLTAEGTDTIDLAGVAEATLAPYRAGGNVRMRGPAVRIPAETARALSLTLHELATNAIKYGALSTSAGAVELVWHVEERNGARSLVIVWSESGGPAVEPPSRRGFGHRLIEQTVAHEPEGHVDLEFLPQGVRCRIEMLLPGEPSARRERAVGAA